METQEYKEVRFRLKYYIGTAILNDLKILFNFEMDSRDRAVILPAGLPQLNNTLRPGIHEPEHCYS